MRSRRHFSWHRRHSVVTVTSLTLIAVLARPAVVTAALVLVVVQRVTVAVQTRVRVTLVDR